MSECSVGKGLNEKCDETLFVRKHGRVCFTSLSEEDQFCLARRTGLQCITDVCLHHKCKYLPLVRKEAKVLLQSLEEAQETTDREEINHHNRNGQGTQIDSR